MKKLISILLAVALCLPFTAMTIEPQISIYAEETTSEIIQNGMHFRTFGEGETQLELFEYSGNGGDIIVPEYIDGKQVTKLCDNVFNDNQNIDSVMLPDSIYIFGTAVFMNSSVSSINIPEKLICIPSYTFYGCTKLIKVKFHEKIDAIGLMAFDSDEIIPENLNSSVSESIILNSDLYYTYMNKNVFETYEGWEVQYTLDYQTMDKKSASIKNYSGDKKNLVIPDNIKGIPVTKVLDNFWVNMNEPCESIVFPPSVTEYGDSNRFFENLRYKNIEIQLSDDITETFNIPDFSNPNNDVVNDTVEKITIKGNIRELSIPDKCFRNCNNFREIIVPQSCKKIQIGEYAFSNSSIENFCTKADIEIKYCAFKDSKNLAIFECGKSNISEFAFENCNSLKAIIMNDECNAESRAFYGCQNLESIDFVGENISDSAFQNCPKLSKINGIEVFDSSKGDFISEVKNDVYKYFRNSNDVGFLNDYAIAQAKKVVSEIITSDMTECEIVKFLHDWVCEHTEYDTEAADFTIAGDNDAGIFMDGKAICEGYARTLNLLLNEAGIPSCVVFSNNHAWNIVTLYGMNFHVDTTWDDGDEITYKWFLKSDDEIRKDTFAHSAWRLPKTLSSIQNFQPSVMPECNAILGDIDMDGTLTINDAVKIMSHVTNTKKYPLSEVESFMADSYDIGDGINNMDALQVQKKLAGIA